ncbi:DUF4012 domain-containing protein [Herbiconiux moechotypicola]|uniref:DUF4012 domain-containing protein n=1 Tax=Herbiconiux moechotypicola TaxID=637393 RepID=A0ABN3DR57_9MICO
MFLVLVAGGAVWVGLSALTVKDELEASRPLLSTVKDKVLAGEATSAQGDAEKLQEHVERAREAVSGPAWAIGEMVPVIGENLVAVRTITNSVSDVVDNAVVPAVQLGDKLSPEVFKPVNGAVDLAAIQSVMPVLDSAGTALTGAKESVSAIKTDTLIGPVKNAVIEINNLVGEVEPAIAGAKSLAPVLPALLGADGARNYLLVFENSAEARPLGGIAGAQILVTADQGRVAISQETSGRDFDFESEDFANSKVPATARQLFLTPFGLQSQNNTLTPRVAVAADLTRSMWGNQRGVTPDTVIFIDPTALSYVLSATGPIALPDGNQLTSENAIDLLLNGVYQMFPEDPDAQDAYFSAAAGLTFNSVMNGNVDIPSFVQAVARGGAERRVVANSTDQSVQTLIEQAGLQGRLPTGTEAAHEVGIYISDYQGSKMDYYLRTAMEVGQATCTDGARKIRVNIIATNVLDPAAVGDTSDFITGGSGNGFRIPRGDLRIFTYVYAPPGATVASITGSTSQEESLVGVDDEYPVARGVLQAGPGETQTVTIDIDVSALPEKEIQTLVAPLIVQPEVAPLSFTC